MKDGSRIYNNNSTKQGAGVSVWKGTFIMEGGTIDQNETEEGGGGVMVNESSTFTMSGGEIKDNNAKDSGGGVKLWQSTFTMTGGEIKDNETEDCGGGVSLSEAIFNMSGGTIQNNTAEYSGGGIVLFDHSSFTKTGQSVIKDNILTLGGSGDGREVFVDDTTSKYRDSNLPEETDISAVWNTSAYTFSSGWGL
jgi:hypothetical protein